MIHPKVKAAAFAALAVAIVSIGNAVTADYSGVWVPVVAALIPVVVGYLKSAEADLITGVPHDVVDPALDGDDSIHA